MEPEPSAAVAKTEEESFRKKPIYLFGKNVLEIKCFRESFICGMCCGVLGGIACFLGTSKVALSTHIGFASLWIGVYGYWFPCRYKYEKQQFILSKMLESKKDLILFTKVESEGNNSK